MADEVTRSSGPMYGSENHGNYLFNLLLQQDESRIGRSDTRLPTAPPNETRSLEVAGGSHDLHRPGFNQVAFCDSPACP